MKKEKISIVLATYNGEKYLYEQLKSIQEQTVQPFEVIIQDDCSTDNTIEVVCSFENKLPLKIFKNDKNLGFTKNFESAIQKSTGDYIALCDQDDIWEKEKIEKLLAKINNHTLVYSNSLLVDTYGKSLGKTLSQKLKNNFISSKSGVNFIFDNCVSAHAMMFKKELLKYLFPFDNVMYFDAYIAATASSLDGVIYTNECLVQYRQHDSNTLSQSKKQKLSLLEKIKKKLQKKQSNNNQILSIVRYGQTIKTLSDNDRKLLQKLEKYLLGFENRWFSIKMFLFLYQNRSNFFAITTKNLFWLCIKKSIGYRLYKVAPFL